FFFFGYTTACIVGYNQLTNFKKKGGSKKEETRTQLLQNEHHKQARGEGRQVAV
ncbi:hypothetical protein BCR44DRAFT_1427118, partial [Catenaria anguillulae PL171]